MSTDAETNAESQIVRRADWHAEEQYPDADSRDSSVWAWEFLRRNAAYEADYKAYRLRYADGADAPHLSLRPRPAPEDLLVNYYCDPIPSRPNLTYRDYAKEAPKHTIYPIRDYLRAKWEINSLPDPTLDWKHLVARTQKSIRGLFARNTVDVLQPVGNLAAPYHLSPASMLCNHGEILVRLRLDGNIGRQLEDLKAQRARFFKKVRASGKRSTPAMMLRTAAYAAPGTGEQAHKTAIHIDPNYIPDAYDIDEVKEESIEIAITGWDEPGPIACTTLHYVLRAADALADLKAGRLTTADNLKRPVSSNGLDVLVELLRKIPNLAGDVFKPEDVQSWLDQADGFINCANYKRLAKSDFEASQLRKGTGKSRL
jgi:hypothetical protein